MIQSAALNLMDRLLNGQERLPKKRLILDVVVVKYKKVSPLKMC